jgi:hypothetical protein
LNVYVPLLLLGNAPYLTAFSAEQLQALVGLLLDVHAYGYAVGLVFFGFHCGILGYLVYKAEFLPRVLGAMLAVAGAGYLFDGFARTLLAGYADFEPVLALVVFIPAFVGELSFCLWLLIKGV